MLVPPRCAGRRRDDAPCQAHPRSESRYCFLHDPESAAAAADAQRLGGMRRRRESTLAGAYDLPGVRTAQDLIRLVEIGLLDLLGLDASINRSRALFAGVMVGAKLLDLGDHGERLAALEAALADARRERRSDPFDEDVA